MNRNLLKTQRRQLGYSQAELAKELRVSAKTLRRWERGRAVPYPCYREQLCAFFGKTAQELGLPERRKRSKQGIS